MALILMYVGLNMFANGCKYKTFITETLIKVK